jgi:CheY-like chemotaxis protein
MILLDKEPEGVVADCHAGARPPQLGVPPTMKTIAVVDDELGLVDVLAASLSTLGYRVVTATNGVQGLEAIGQQTPDLVVLDFMMPRLDGPEVLQAMQADTKLSTVPVILMSAMPESVVGARCQGYVAFLRKPFSFDAVVNAVTRALGGGELP